MSAGIANCPSCKSYRSVKLHLNQLSCQCGFKVDVLCPYCNVGQLSEEQNQLDCSHCERSITQGRLAYILENRLMVNTKDRCQYCNSPTLSRLDSNITPRCFDFPNCGNQEQLFGQPTRDRDYVFLDFETTGLEIGNESIIEIGACKVTKDGQETFFQELIKPVNEIKPLITNITGIDNEMVKDAPGLKDVMSSFLEFSKNTCLVAHNAQFDIPWLLTTLLRYNLDIPFSELLCTLKWAKTKEEGKRSLGALSKKYNIGHENAHRALADAVVTKSLFFIYDQDNAEKPFESIDRYLAMSKKIVNQFPSFIQA
ncbi:MAG: PolC-type DNA polymerase III [Candidatus Marinamargulisbacteria bacterium]